MTGPAHWLRVTEICDLIVIDRNISYEPFHSYLVEKVSVKMPVTIIDTIGIMTLLLIDCETYTQKVIKFINHVAFMV